MGASRFGSCVVRVLSVFADRRDHGTSFAQSVEWEKVDAAIGRKATVLGDVHRYGFPRSDLNVSLDDVILKPAFALGGWVAFKPMNAEVMVMGDLVLLGTEITPVMTKLITLRGWANTSRWCETDCRRFPR